MINNVLKPLLECVVFWQLSFTKKIKEYKEIVTFVHLVPGVARALGVLRGMLLSKRESLGFAVLRTCWVPWGPWEKTRFQLL